MRPILPLLLVLALPGCTPRAEVCRTKRIAAVGGCDAQGRCGTRFEDGETGVTVYPVVGKDVRVCLEAPPAKERGLIYEEKP